MAAKHDLATLVGGIALGVVGSRLLPPLIAMAIGSRKADPVDRLIQDHRDILSILSDMEQTPADATARRTKQLLMLKRCLGKHALAEEDVVYPVLHESGDHVEQIRNLYDEHADIKIHLYELERLLMEGSDWRGRVNDLHDLIAAHAREEEEVEFPRLREILNQRGGRMISGQVYREEALIL
jgi:hemerythrin superfamily protein